MIMLLVVGYILIVGAILATEGYQNLIDQFHRHGIDITIKHKADKSFTVSATKNLPSGSIKHVEFSGTDLFGLLGKLLKEVELNLESWFSKILY